jgi:hypothetical protein
LEQIGSFAISLGITFITTALITLTLRTSLARILIDLCGTQVRAQFWTTFSSILLVGVPFVNGLGYEPASPGESLLFFEIAQQIRANLMTHLFTVMMLGGGIAFFALVAPRPASAPATELKPAVS